MGIKGIKNSTNWQKIQKVSKETAERKQKWKKISKYKKIVKGCTHEKRKKLQVFPKNHPPKKKENRNTKYSKEDHKKHKKTADISQKHSHTKRN